MSKIMISVLLSLVLAGGMAAGIAFTGHSRESCRSCEQTGEELALVREQIASLSEDTKGLIREVRRLEGLPRAESASEVEQRSNSSGASRAAPEEVASVDRPGEIKGYLLAALEEDRKQRETERQQQREQQKEEARQRAEARQKEQAELKEGPYDKFNVKINSAAKALGLSDSQKQTYYQLLKASRDKLQEEMGKNAPAAGAEGATPEGNAARGRDQWKKAREVAEGVQKEFTESVQAMLTASQREAFLQLSATARSFRSLGSVTESGDRQGFPGASRDSFTPGPRRKGPGAGGR